MAVMGFLKNGNDVSWTWEKKKQHIENNMAELTVGDGVKLGKITNEGFKALQNNSIDGYTPFNETEKKTIEAYKSYAAKEAVRSVAPYDIRPALPQVKAAVGDVKRFSSNIKSEREEDERRASKYASEFGFKELQAMQNDEEAKAGYIKTNISNGLSRFIAGIDDEEKAKNEIAEHERNARVLQRARVLKGEIENEQKTNYYNALTSKVDFEDNSKYNPKGFRSFNEKYYLVNISSVGQTEDEKNFGVLQRGDKKYSFMTPEEVKIYNYLYNTNDTDEEANEYLNHIDRELNKRVANEESEQTKKYTKENPTGAVIGNIISSPLSIGGMVETAKQNIVNEFTGRADEVDINAPAFGVTRFQRDTASTLTEGKGVISSLLIETGLSIGQMAAALPFGSVGSLSILSSNAASSAAYDATKRGASAGEALGVGVTAGLIEALTEKIGIERWFRIAKMPPTTWKKAISTIAKQAGVEGVEELISEVLNNIADSAIMDEKSNYNALVKQYVDEGYSSAEAKNKAFVQLYLQNPAKAFVGGALSGFALGGAGVLLGNTANRIAPSTEPNAQSISSDKNMPLPNIDIKTPPSTEIAKNGPVKTADVNSAIERIVNGTATNKDIDLFKPANAQNRAMFEEATGVKLPSTNSEVRHYLRDYAKNQAVGTENVKTDNLTMPDVESVPNVQNNVDDNIQGNLNILSKIANKYPVNVISPQQTEVTAEGQNITLNNPLQNNLNNSNNNDIINTIGGMNDVRTDSNSSGQERGTIESASKQSTPIPEWRQFGNKRINEFVRISNEQYGSKEIYGGNGEKITYTSSAGNTQKSDAEILVRNEGKKCGVDVEYATDLTVTLKDGKIVRPLAFSDGNKVVLSDRATFKDAAHEFSHEIKRKNPQKYETVKTYIKNNMDTGLYGFMLEDYINEYSEIYGFDKNNLTESQLDIIEEELICDIAAYNKIGANTTMPNEAEFTEVVNEYYNGNSSRLVEYESGNQRQRNDIVNSFEDVKFSVKNSDTDYLKAVESGDMKTAQKMVDEAAKAAGYNSPKLYHGTSSFGFTEFDLSKMDDKRTIFLTSNEKIASTYSGVSGERKISDVYNKPIESLPVEDVAKELNKFVKEYYKDTFESADYNYSYYNLETLNKLISTVNDGLMELKSEVEQKIIDYADKMAIDFDDATAKAHRQLVSLKERLDKWDYHNLSTPIYLLIHHTDVFADNSAKYADLEANIRLMNDLRANQDITDGVVVEESLGRYSIEVMSKADAVSKLKSLSQKGNYALYAKMEKPLIIDGRAQNWNNIKHWSDGLIPSKKMFELADDDEFYYLKNKVTGRIIKEASVDILKTDKMSSSETIDFLINKYSNILAIKYENVKTTREISKVAKDMGYGSIVIKNITDNGGRNYNIGMEETADIYMLFDGNNVKSADPVTYDDKGKVIPLSERFNKQDNDIRYSFDRGKKSPDYYQQKYSEYLEQYGTIEKGMQPRLNNAEVPRKTGNNQYVSNFARTMAETDGIANAMDGEFEKMVVDGTMSHEVFTNKKAENGANRRINRDDFKESVKEFETLVNAGRVNKEDIAMGQMLLNIACQNKDVELAKKLAVDLSVAATQFGQNVQAFSMLKRMSPDGQLYYLEKSVEKINREIRDKYKDIAPIEIDNKLAENLLNAKTKEEVNEAVYAIEKNIGEQIPATKMDKWNAWRYLAMLGNTRTHFRNICGNAVFAPARGVKNIIGAGFEKALPKAERTKSLTKTKESKDFAENDWSLMADVVKGNEGKYGTRRGIEEHRKIFKTKWLEAARKFNTNALEIEDGWFLESAYKSAFAQAMTARGLTAEYLSSGTKQADEDLQKIREYAINEAQRATYRDSNEFSDFVSRLRFNGDGKLKKGANMLIEGVLPFKKTPANILVRGVEYSPVGLVKGMTYDLYQVKKGNISAAKAIDNISAGLTGTAIVGLGALLAHLGALVVAPDEDDEVTGYKKMLGAQNYALKIGDNTYTIDWMAPIALPLFVGAEITNTIKNTEQPSLTAIFDALTRISEPVLELSCLSGIQSALESIQYSNGNIVGDLVIDMISSYVTQALPTIGGQVARTIDNTQRNIYYKDKTSGVPQVIQGIINKAMSKVPGLTYFLPEKVDRWGRVQKYGSLPERVLENFVSPGYYSNDKSTFTDKKLTDLYEKTGDKSVLPDVAAKSFKVDGDMKYMSADEYVEYSKERGSLSYEYITSFLNEPGTNTLDDSLKVEVVNGLYKYANAKAKEKVSDYILDKQYAKVDEAKKAGISPDKYFVAYYCSKGKESDKTASGKTIPNSATRKEFKEIKKNVTGLSEAQKIKLLKIMGYSDNQIKMFKYNLPN